MMSANVTLAITVGTAVISSGLGVYVLQWFLTRKQRQRDEDKQIEKDRIDREREKGEHRKLLAEAQSVAQRTALDSAATRYTGLENDYRLCREGLRDVRDAAGLLIDVFESLLMKMQPLDKGESYSITLQAAEIIEVRHSIAEARRHLLYFTDWKAPLRDELRDREQPQGD